jgi:hypothetical protein
VKRRFWRMHCGVDCGAQDTRQGEMRSVIRVYAV